MNKNTWKRLSLAGLLIALLLGITGCFTKPDKTVDDLPTDPVQVLPFETATPTPSPGPTGSGTGDEQSGWEDWENQTPAVVITRAPTPAPTLQLHAPSPTPAQIAVAMPTVRPSAAPTDDGTLRNGSTGTAVRQIQQRLKDLGYYTGAVDGTFGAATESAVRAFQGANGLTADGVVGSRTLNTLNSASAVPMWTALPSSAYATNRPTPMTYTPSTLSTYRYLQLGGSGNDVRQLQQRLTDLGYFHGGVNGSFGEDTKAAVEAFQFRNGIWVDGVAGEQTQRLLFSDAALPYAAIAARATVAAQRTLKSGMTGDDVSQLQTRLNALYYFNDAINGQYGATTELAVRVFQQRNGLTVDGVAGSGTLAALYASTALYAPTALPTATAFRAGATLESGSVGQDVYRLQERLYDLGYYNGRIDGVYSDAVATAVRTFQSANGLTVDGKAGGSTQTLLYSTKAKAASTVDDSFATLREGDTGERVRALQNLLATYGYFADTIDGRYGATTVTAVMQMQATNGLTTDGVAGPATQQLLYQGTPKAAAVVDTPQKTTAFQTLQQGMAGNDVMVLQQYLHDMGYFIGTPDSTFGSTTFVAVQAFQRRNNLKADGIAGSETLALLYSGNGVAADGAVVQGFSIDADDSSAYAVQTNEGAPQRTAIKQGDEGQDVYDLQARLSELGYFTGTPDGVFGNSTVSAVRGFQQSNGLTLDGVAGAATRAALYAVGVTASGQTGTEDLTVVSNRTRELEEQRASGAIQGSLSGGGVAASLNGSVYYAGASGALYVTADGSDKKLYNGPASFIHATDRGITFVSGGRILRIGKNGGTPETLVEAGGIEKLALLGETMYYLEGSSLIRLNSGGESTIIAAGVKDFALDVYQYTAYTASVDGVRSVPLVGDSGGRLLVAADVDQVQLCDSVVFFRSGGAIYRIQDGVSMLLADADATWMGIYREMIYYISGDRLYRCGTDGQNSQVFHDGQTAGVSFVAGKAYITKSPGGAVAEILPVE